MQPFPIRSVGNWILILFAVWLLVVGLMAWVTVGDQTLGIFQAIPLGLPAWHLIAPAYGALSLILLLIRPPATYWYLTLGHVVFAFAICFALLLSWEWLGDRFGLAPTFWSIVMFLPAAIAALVVIVMDIGEPVSLTLPAARIAYFGRFKHLRELYRLAQQRGWKASDPRGFDHVVEIAGKWRGRDVAILSGEDYFPSGEGDTTFFYRVAVAATSILPVIFVAFKSPEAHVVADALHGQCRTSGKRVIDFYVLPDARLTLAPDTIERLTQVLDRGRRFLRSGSTLSTEYKFILFGQKSSVRMTDDAAWMAELVDWVTDVASTLEKVTEYVPFPAAVRETSPTETDETARPSPSPRKPVPAITSPLSLARRALLALLLTIGFYGLALVIVGALLFIVYADVRWASTVSGPLILVCVVVAAAILWSILPRRDRFEAPGPQLLPDDHPRLLREVEVIAQQMGQAMPRDVYLTPEVKARVMERGGMLGIGSRRVMALGLPLLQMLTVSQLHGVIAHEFGHFYSGDTRLTPWVYKMRSTIGRTIQNLGSGSWLQAPFRWYGLMFLRATQGISRHQEFVADSLAGRLVGTQTYVDGLRTFSGHAAAFDAYIQEEFDPILLRGFCPPLLEGFDRFIHVVTIAGTIDHIVDEQTQSQISGPYDSHPSLGERLAALAAQPAAGTVELDTSLAVTLLDDVASAERSLMAAMIRPEYWARMQPVTWDEVGERVYLPLWRNAVVKHAASLAGVTPAALPDFQAAPVALVAQIRQQAEHTLLDQEIAEAIPAITGAALTAALAGQGWAIDATPGIAITLRHDGEAVQPFVVTHMLADGSLTGEAWLQRCRELDISDLDLAAAAPSQVAG